MDFTALVLECRKLFPMLNATRQTRRGRLMWLQLTKLSNLEHSNVCDYCADHDILCSFADGSLCRPLHVIVSSIGLNTQEHIFPMAIKIHLFSGQPMLHVFIFSNEDETIQLGLTALSVTQQLAVIGNLLSLVFPSFFLEWLPSHSLLNSCTAQNALCHSFVAGLRQGMETFSVCSENAADVSNGKA